MSHLLRQAVVNHSIAIHNKNDTLVPNNTPEASIKPDKGKQRAREPAEGFPSDEEKQAPDHAQKTEEHPNKGKQRGLDPPPAFTPGEGPPIYELEPLPRYGTSPIQYYKATSDYDPANDFQNLPRDSLSPHLTLGGLQRSNYAERRKYLGFVEKACNNAHPSIMGTTMRDEFRGLEAFCTHLIYFTTWARKVEELLRKTFRPETAGEELWRALAEVQKLYHEQHEELWARVEDGEAITRRQADSLFLTFFCSHIDEHPGLRGPSSEATDGREPMVGRLRYFSDTMQRVDLPERMLWTLMDRLGDVDLRACSGVGNRIAEAKWKVILEMKGKVAIAKELLDVSERCGIRTIRELRRLAVELRDLDMALEVFQGTFYEIEEGQDLYPIKLAEDGRAIFLQES